MSIFEELLAAAETTDFAPRGRMEKAEVFLARLMKAIHRVDKDVWDRLTEGAQAWYVRAARRFNARLSIDEVPTGYQEAIEAAGNEGLTEAVRTAVLLHPDFSKADILKTLEVDGWDTKHLAGNQTVAVVRSVTLATIKIAKKIGRWNDAPLVMEGVQQ